MTQMIRCWNPETGKFQDFPEHVVKDASLMARIGFVEAPTPEPPVFIEDVEPPTEPNTDIQEKKPKPKK